jgi:hypothetical protein
MTTLMKQQWFAVTKASSSSTARWCSSDTVGTRTPTSCHSCCRFAQGEHGAALQAWLVSERDEGT